MPTKKTAGTAAPEKKATKTASAAKSATAKKPQVKKTATKTSIKVEKTDVAAPAKTESVTPSQRKKGVLFVASEAFPYAGTGGLGEVIGSLPKNLNKLGKYDARVIVPLYESIGSDVRAKMQYLGNIYVPLAWRMQY